MSVDEALAQIADKGYATEYYYGRGIGYYRAVIPCAESGYADVGILQPYGGGSAAHFVIQGGLFQGDWHTAGLDVRGAQARLPRTGRTLQDALYLALLAEFPG